MLPADWHPATTWRAAVDLLEVSKTARGAQPDDASSARWGLVCLAVEEIVADEPDALTADVTAQISALVNDAQTAHAAAWALDRCCWDRWPHRWWRELGCPTKVQLRAGDPYPVSDWVGPVPSGGFSVRPSQVHTAREELPHLRFWGAGSVPGSEAVDVVVRFDAADDVDSAVSASTVVTLHPNARAQELRPWSAGSSVTGAVFPVAPADEATQLRRLTDRFDAASHRRAGLVVGTEVSLSPRVVSGLQAHIDAHWATAASAFVAGSMHELIGPPHALQAPANVAYWLRPNALPHRHRKIVPFGTNAAGVHDATYEAIEGGERRLTVWQGLWSRFAILICKDLLDDGIVHALERIGVNLLAVPSFSEDTFPHEARLHGLLAHSQLRAAMANGPTLDGHGVPVSPTAIFVQPVRRASIETLAVDPSTPIGFALQEWAKSPKWTPLP